jgi:hypothetical protein
MTVFGLSFLCSHCGLDRVCPILDMGESCVSELPLARLWPLGMREIFLKPDSMFPQLQ